MRLFPLSIALRMNMINVTDSAYGAMGDGVTDDTAALDKAIEFAINRNNRYSSPQFIFHPPDKTYQISDTLFARLEPDDVPNGFSDGWRAGCIRFSIDSETTKIRLAANAAGFQDPAAIKPMFQNGSEKQNITWGGNPTGAGNEAFRHGDYHFTFDTNGNPGASALNFIGSNRASVEGCLFTSPTQTGYGFYCTRGDNGPMLILGCEFENLLVGVRQAGFTYSVSLSDNVFRNQGLYAVQASNAKMPIEDLRSFNNVIAVRQTEANGMLSIVESEFRLNSGQSRSASYGLQADGRVEVQNLKTTAYTTPIRNTRNGAVDIAESSLAVVNATPIVESYTTYAKKQLFPSTRQPLPIKSAPDAWPGDNESLIAVYGDYGGSTVRERLQNTLNAGRPFVFLPSGGYAIDDAIFIPEHVTKVISFQGSISAVSGTTPTIYVEGSGDRAVILEHLYITVPLVNRSSKALHVKHCDIQRGYRNTPEGIGDVFFTDVIASTQDGSPPILIQHGQRCWARQLNVEFATVQVEVIDSSFWALGTKIETGGQYVGRCLKATNSEVQLVNATVYALSNNVNASTPKTPAIELVDCKNVLLSYSCFNPTIKHDVQIRETIDGETRELLFSNLNGPAEALTEYTGGKQMGRLMAIVSNSSNTGTFQADSTWRSLTNLNLSANYNPFNYGIDSNDGIITIDSGPGIYKFEIVQRASVPFVSGANNQMTFSSPRLIIDGSTSDFIAFGSETSPARLMGISTSGFYTAVGTAPFTVKLQETATTNPVGLVATLDSFRVAIYKES